MLNLNQLIIIELYDLNPQTFCIVLNRVTPNTVKTDDFKLLPYLGWEPPNSNVLNSQLFPQHPVPNPDLKPKVRNRCLPN